MTSTLAIGAPYIPSWLELRPFLPELWLTLGMVAVLLTPFFTPRKSNFPTAVAALLALVLALVSLIAVGASANPEGSRFAGMLLADPVSAMFKGILLVFVIGVVLMWMTTTAPTMHEGDGPEFFTLLLGATLGMSLMASASNLLMLFIAVEMASLPSYVLAGFRKTHRVGSEASLKYVLFGAAASSIMVYGLSMLYGLTGSLSIAAISQHLAANGASVPLIVGLAGVLVGLGFKISAVPLHFWCPDVFEGAHIDVTTFLSVASKGAGLVLLLRLVMSIASGGGYHADALVAMAVVIGVIGAITATVGNAAAFYQTNIKRLLAYSSIAHAGYMLCALSLLASPDGESAAAQAILLYLAVYLFMNLGAFTVAGLIYRATGSEDINDYAGMARRNPLLAITMAACLISMVGIPPFAGFWAKFYLIYFLGAAGGWWWVLVGVIAVNTVISLYYYARVLREMFLANSDEPAIHASPLGVGLSVASAAMLVVIFAAVSPLLNMAAGHSRFAASPAQSPPAAVSLSR